MNFVIFATLAAALAYAVFDRGAVDPPTWNAVILGVAIAAAIFHFIRKTPDRRHLDTFTTILLAAVLLTSAAQLIPLPLPLIKSLSPARHEILTALPTIPTAAPLSNAPRETTQYLVHLLGCLTLLLTIRGLSFELQNPWVLTWPLLAIAGLQAALGFFQSYAEGAEGFARGAYVNRDHFAGLLEMILPFALLYPLSILQRDSKRHESPAMPAVKASAILAIAALILIGIIHSLSRMGFLAALASSFVTGSIAFTLRGWRVEYQRVPMPLWRRAIPAVLVGLIVLLGFVFLPTDPLIARFSDFTRVEVVSADTRAQIWRDTTILIKAYPLTGCGWGAYEATFLKFKTVAPMNTVNYAHNDYFQVLAELGIVGFVAGLIFVLRLVGHTIRGATYSMSFDERYLAIACIGSFTAILLHSFVDFNMYIPANSLVFAWIAGIASVHLRKQRRAIAPVDPESE